MKLILLSFLLLSLFTISMINASERVFINLIPYNTDQCDGPITGVGYSTIVYTCSTYDYINNYVFKIQKDERIVMDVYKSNQGTQICENENFDTRFSTLNGNCVPYYQIGNLNLNLNVVNKNAFFKVTISGLYPLLPSNSIVKSLMPLKCESDSNNALLYEYYTNGTIIDNNNGIDSLFYCRNGKPWAKDNDSPPSTATLVCNQWSSFYNSSYEVLPSDSTTACWTGSGGDSCSGSGSGTPSSSSSSSSSHSHTSSSSIHSGGTSGSGSSGNSGTSGSSAAASSSGSGSGSGSGFASEIIQNPFSNSDSEPLAYLNVYCFYS